MPTNLCKLKILGNFIVYHFQLFLYILGSKHAYYTKYSFAIFPSSSCTENLLLVSLLPVKYFKYICALVKLLMIAKMFMLTLFSTEEKVKN